MAAHNFHPARRGNHAVYREGETNHCPGCGRTHWHIGRTTAECAFCATALALVDGCNQRDHRPVILKRGRGGGRIKNGEVR